MADDVKAEQFNEFHEVKVPHHHMANAMQQANLLHLGLYGLGRKGVRRAKGFNVCHNQAHATINTGREEQHAKLLAKMRAELEKRKKS